MASHLDRRPVGILPCHPIDLRTEHLPQALELSQALRWPYRLEDWVFAHQLGRGFAVEIEGRLAGTALWWPYGDRHASAGMVSVNSALHAGQRITVVVSVISARGSAGSPRRLPAWCVPSCRARRGGNGTCEPDT